MTVRYVKPAQTIDEVEDWCAANGLRPFGLERGPDGMIRGTAVPADDATGALPPRPGEHPASR